MTTQFNIAIDGPAGAGKSTVARIVARRLDLTYIDTGAMYRVVTYAAILAGISCDDEQSLVALAKRITSKVTTKGHIEFYYNGQQVSGAIRSQQVNQSVSLVAKHNRVRSVLVQMQQAIAHQCPRGVVMDGRDIGTNVLPMAQLKVYLTAKLAQRAERRFNELKLKGTDTSLMQVQKQLQKRDKLDKERAFAPLIIANDAVKIDTTDISVSEVVEEILQLVTERKAIGEDRHGL